MPRPKTVSDEEILAASLEVLAAKGESFTLNDLAERIGLSRASLIQRFGDRTAIIHRIATHELDMTQIWLGALATDLSCSTLQNFLETIVGSMGEGHGFAARVSMAALEARDPVLRQLARARYQLVQDAIAARLPPGPHQHEVAAHLHSIIAGASMQWLTTEAHVGLADFVNVRLRWALDYLPEHFKSR